MSTPEFHDEHARKADESVRRLRESLAKGEVRESDLRIHEKFIRQFELEGERHRGEAERLRGGGG